MKLGIVGLPNVGKSTLFNSITRAGAQAANYPFCTIEPNKGVVAVPDERLDLLAEFYHTGSKVPAVVEFVDIAGLVKGASRGEGLGNQFLAHIRECDALVHVVRCFEDGNVVHVDGSVDPLRDIETVELELVLADLETLEKRIAKVKKLANNVKEAKGELDTLLRLKSHLEESHPAITFEAEDEDEKRLIDSLLLITSKPVIYAANVSEEELATDGETDEYVRAVRAHALDTQSAVFVISARIEEEIAELGDEEKQEYLTELGLMESGLDRLVRAGYDLLGLMSFLTAGEKECRAWTIKKGTKAPEAAGRIHSDFERGFIRAEVINYQDLLDAGSMAAAREKGLVRSEGRDYVVRDGDTILFRFNV